MSERSFDELLTQAQAGCQEALGELLDKYRNYLLVIANADLDPDLRAKGGASDLVQETFLEANRDFAAFQGRGENALQAWLRGILNNNLADFRKAYRRAERRDVGKEQRLGESHDLGKLPGHEQTPSWEAATEEEAERLRLAVAQLSEEHRTVLELRHRERLRFAEIGERMGRSSDAARMLWARAVERLEEVLKQDS